MGWAADTAIALDHRAEVPLGVQFAWSVRAAVAAGRLRPGERLPALRELADELGVNHNTLRAAVAKLEGDGVLERRHGSGTFVAEEAAAHERHAPLVQQVVRWAADAGVGQRELAAALYVEPATTSAPADAAAEERRALRDDIAVLERVLAGIEARLPVAQVPRGESAARTAGARVLGADDLREQRDAVVRRIALAQQALDGETAEPQSEEPATAPAPARKPRRATVPRPQPT
jgi:DNA-binding transcriptional regulator YhcF (GntR family)